MTAQAEKIAEKVGGEKAAGQVVEKAPGKIAEKLIEKRRALGRGLESLLPGPRAVTSENQFSVPGSQFSGKSLEPQGAQGSTGENSIQYPATSTQKSDSARVAGESFASGVETAPVPGAIAELNAAAGTPRRAAEGLPIVEIPLDQVDHNPYQTRTKFEAEELAELATSILAQGVIQPIVVRPGKEGRYILILGERRLRASKIAGKTTIPAVVRRVSEQQAAEMTLVENLQRQDLNCMDQAAAFRHLSQKFNLTQEEIGNRVGVSRQTVANYMRLTRLPGMTSVYLQNGDLTYSHARELLRIEDDETLEKMAERVVKEKMSVDKLEEVILNFQFDRDCVDENAGLQKEKRGARWVDPNVRAQQRSLETFLGLKVRIRDRRGKGTIRIEYGSLEDFDRVVAMLKGKKQ